MKMYLPRVTTNLIGVLALVTALGCSDEPGDDDAEWPTKSGSDQVSQSVEHEVGAVEQALATARFNLNANCESRRSEIQAAANKALELLQKTGRSDASFTKWFGVTKSNLSAWNTYHVIVNNINLYAQESLLRLGAAARETAAVTVTFRCDSNSVDAARVVPGTPATIRLNASFWFQPNSGQESKAGIIIHELTHLAGTLDVPQPHRDNKLFAIGLAQESPSRALSNANNHEFYYEGL